MFIFAYTLTNIELAVECKAYSLLDWTGLASPVPSLPWRYKGTFVKVIDLLSWVKWESKENSRRDPLSSYQIFNWTLYEQKEQLLDCAYSLLE